MVLGVCRSARRRSGKEECETHFALLCLLACWLAVLACSRCALPGLPCLCAWLRGSHSVHLAPTAGSSCKLSPVVVSVCNCLCSFLFVFVCVRLCVCLLSVCLSTGPATLSRLCVCVTVCACVKEKPVCLGLVCWWLVGCFCCLVGWLVFRFASV
jgi:hypothetical protein